MILQPSDKEKMEQAGTSWQRRILPLAIGSYQSRRLPILFRFLVLTLGALHAWAAATSHSMNADGINYLDIADAYMQGDWQTAINAVWSPMYSWILGPVMHLLKPPMRWEFPVVHLVNFSIYLGALVCFEFFWRQVMRYAESRRADTTSDGWITLPEWTWLLLGYTLFMYSSLSLIQMWAVTPDMLMSALVYLAAGLLLRMRLGHTSWRTYILFGGVLGLSYLAKAVMFPLAFVFLITSLFAAGRNVYRAIPRTSIALLSFLSVSMPFIVAISLHKGEFTFSDAGKLTYARYMNGVPYPHWQGDPPVHGTPAHPTRKILDDPPLYEFGAPIGGTYPVSYDPAYWYEGVIVHFDLERQVDYLSFSALFYFDLFFRQQAGLLVGVFLLYLMGHHQWPGLTEIVFRWGLVVVALAAFGSYGLVNVLGRYVGVFVVLFWADLFANVRLLDSPTSRRLTFFLSIIMILFVLMNIGASNLEGVRALVGWGNPHQAVVSHSEPLSWPGEVAEVLHRLGVEPGAKVAIIGYGFDSFWARLARVRIVAEMPGHEADAFWEGDPSFQAEVLQAFARTGAKAIVAERVPSYATLSGWYRVGYSNYYVYMLTE